jgi:1-acyl-sn-glycerol-3-phosphate acyltransferase
LIIIINHINFLEVPLLFVYLKPRDVVGMIKRETWKNPVLGALANSWGAISIDRNGSDMSAMRDAIDVLEHRGILILAPEGTRSVDGRLQQGHGGVVQLALRSGVPIMPVVHHGGQNFWRNLKSWRRTGFFIKVGPAFRLVPPVQGISRSVRHDMTECIMNRMSLLLPQHLRGAYPEPEKAIEAYRHLVQEIQPRSVFRRKP